MTTIQFNENSIELEAGETVLDGLLRHGHNISYGCKSGACQTCLLKADYGQLPSKSQSGLKPSQKTLGYFLSCVCIPDDTALRISQTDESDSVTQALVERIFPLNDSVFLLSLKVEDFRFIPGQFITLWRDKACARCYSIASAGEEAGIIELHIKHIPDGRFSAWAFNQLKPGDQLKISGPTGECFYSGENKSAPMILAGIGTGLAPLYGILRYALNRNHKGKIDLYFAANTPEGLYLISDLRELEAQHPSLSVHLICKEVGSGKVADVIEYDIYEFIKRAHPSTTGCHAYVCGGESFVRKLRKQLFLCGANSKDIFCDIFLPLSG